MDLVANHQSLEHLAADTDERFLPRRDMRDYRYRLVRQFTLDMPVLAHELKMIRAPFNPIGRYYELQPEGVPPFPLPEFRPYDDFGPPPPPPPPR